MSKDPLVRRSKHLSLVLRHNPASAGITLDAAGWVDVATLLPAMKLSMDQLEEVVGKNDKKRFEFNADKTRIRASQGHSVDVDLGYEEKEPPERLYHGTSKDVLDPILREGLRPMARHDVHLSPNVDTAHIVARRRRNPVVLEVFAGLMAKDGFKFRLSTNGVWLTEHVPPKYLDLLA
jgi:putative RNA 2'-phosphotransferase